MSIGVRAEDRRGEFLLDPRLWIVLPPCSSEMMTVRSDSQSAESYTQFAMRSASMNSMRSRASRVAVSV